VIATGSPPSGFQRQTCHPFPRSIRVAIVFPSGDQAGGSGNHCPFNFQKGRPRLPRFFGAPPGAVPTTKSALR
jgi:hypothetical protein